MALLIDTKERTYGLQAEPGFVPMDNKAVDFTLGQDLQIGVADLVVPVTQLSQTRQTAQTDASRPRLYFEPDGSIGDGSPQTIMIREIRGETIWVTRSRNGFNYEISTNAFQRTSR